MASANPDHDVVIMGGGPAGASLGALLARETSLSVAIYEAEIFPREHIGESFSSLIIPCLHQTGALERVLASECYVKKYGGYYAWDPLAPAVALFRHHLWERDGYLRWSIHVNRSEFDHILLQHAGDSGVRVFEGVTVKRVTRDGGLSRVEFEDGTHTTCRVFVDASGRWNSVNPSSRRAFLSNYRNIAIWSHFLGGKLAQSLDREWNIFRRLGVSSIGCFAFQDGWFWYIPVPKIIDGRRVLTHSLGVVTDPRVLKQPGRDLTEMRVLVDTARRVPLLQELIGDIEPVREDLLTRTNYSMISARMCDYDEKWLLVGDAAYFVDPLFSSGVNFALVHALLAFHLIRTTFDQAISETARRHLWSDYHQGLAQIGRTFALAIDQWYADIAAGNPDSIYWGERGSRPTFENRMDTFHALLNSDFETDLIRILTRGSYDLGVLGDGPLTRALEEMESQAIAPDARVRLRSGIAVTESMTLDHAPDLVPLAARKPSPVLHGPYWTDPLRFSGAVGPLVPGPSPCHRFIRGDDPDARQVTFFPAIDNGLELCELLRGPARPYRELEEMLSPPQRHLLQEMHLAGMLEIEAPTCQSCPTGAAVTAAGSRGLT